MKEIKYNFETIDMLINQYVTLTEDIDSLMVDLNYIIEIFADGYTGQASSTLLPELFQKKIEHVELLKLCYSNMGEYVMNAKNVMSFIDGYLGNNMAIYNNVGSIKLKEREL